MQRLILLFCAAVLALTANAQPHAVDLGLSVKWASCNIGASSPEDYGDYFAWGETVPKKEYSWDTYKWSNGYFNKLTKYCPSDRSGYWGGSESPDNRLKLLPEDDAARRNWGRAWRMPTEEEWKELMYNCKCVWTTQRGVDGYKFTSNKNGNSIFLPAAGQLCEEGPWGNGTCGRYWSSVIYPNMPYIASSLRFYANGVFWFDSLAARNNGRPIRPVCDR